MRHMPDANDVQHMIDRALRAERQRLHAALLTAAKGLGGSAQAAVEAVARVVGEGRE